MAEFADGMHNAAVEGAIAQLGERVVRNDEVGGSIPPGSTNIPDHLPVTNSPAPLPMH